jgi:hypothetical protein
LKFKASSSAKELLLGSFHFLIAQSSAEKNDGFVKKPISALHFIALSLRRTARTPHSTGFACLELGLFTKPSVRMTFYESIKNVSGNGIDSKMGIE